MAINLKEGSLTGKKVTKSKIKHLYLPLIHSLNFRKCMVNPEPVTGTLCRTRIHLGRHTSPSHLQLPVYYMSHNSSLFGSVLGLVLLPVHALPVFLFVTFRFSGFV